MPDNFPANPAFHPSPSLPGNPFRNVLSRTTFEIPATKKFVANGFRLYKFFVDISSKTSGRHFEFKDANNEEFVCSDKWADRSGETFFRNTLFGILSYESIQFVYLFQS